MARDVQEAMNRTDCAGAGRTHTTEERRRLLLIRAFEARRDAHNEKSAAILWRSDALPYGLPKAS
jgi:hypothetical protein